MKKSHLQMSADGIKHISFDELYEEISSDWEDKARKLKIRRNRAMKRAVREGHLN